MTDGMSEGTVEKLVRLRAENERLRAALKSLVDAHDYFHLDLKIGSKTPDGMAWLNARETLKR